MRLRLIVLFSLFSLILTSSAQMNATLVEPSAEEYLSHVRELYASIDGWAEKSDFSAVARLEIEYRYDIETLSYDELKELQQIMSFNSYWYYPFFGNVDGMHYTLVMAYLRENDIALNELETLNFDDYNLFVTPLDFSGDGNPEYLIEVDYLQRGHHAFWIVRETDTGYERVQTPSLWTSTDCLFRDSCSSTLILLSTDDINSDGRAELVYARNGYCGYGWCGGNIAILGWRDGILEELVLADPDIIALEWAGNDYFGGDIPSNVEWELANFDQDETLEMSFTWQFSDNHACNVNRMQIFDWNGENYIGRERETYEDTLGCALRAGFLGMGNNNYLQAIESYERAIELTENAGDEQYLREVHQYARIRLAIANALIGNEDVATEQIENLAQLDPAAEVLGHLIDGTQSYLDNTDPIAMCWTVQQNITGTEVWGFASSFDSYAGLDDLNRSANYAGGRASPARSGCDATEYLIYRLINIQTNADALLSPLEMIEPLDMTVSDFVVVDTNQDSLDDYFVWIEDFDNRNMFFLSGNTGYKISQQRISLPSENSEFAVVLTPAQNPLLAILHYPDTNILCEGDSPLSGALRLYEIYESGIPSFHSESFTLCEFFTLNDLDFPSGELTLWSSEFEAIPVTWSDTSERYSYYRTRQQRIEDAGIFSCGVTGFYFCGFDEEDPAIAIDIIDTYLSDPETASIGTEPGIFYADFTTGIEYRRALALEQLGRIDEALAAYQELAESDTVWGELAALHIQF